MRTAFLAVVVLIVGCSVGAPATPSPAPPTASAQPTPTLAPTVMGTPVATVSPAAAGSPAATASPAPAVTPSCDPDYGYGCDMDTAPPTSSAGGVVVDTAESAQFGTYLVTGTGLALYTNANDTADQSSCGSGCEDNWPPLSLSAGQQVSAGAGVDGTFATVTRDDGSTQVTYNGHPLYRFVGDAAPGDTSGQDINNVWFLAQP